MATCQNSDLAAALIQRRGTPQGGAGHGCSCSGLCYLENVLSRVRLLGSTSLQPSPWIPPRDCFWQLSDVERKNLPVQEAVSELFHCHEESCWNLLCWELEHCENPCITNTRTVNNASFVLGPGVNQNCTSALGHICHTDHGQNTCFQPPFCRVCRKTVS